MNRRTSTFAALTLVAATVLTGCGDDTDAAPAEPTTSAASETTAESQDTAPPTKKPDAAPAGATVKVGIKGDNVTPTALQLDLAVGDTLTLVVTSDRGGEMHVHSSPEQTLDFPAGTTKLEVTLEKPGQVDIEEHESGVLITRLLVK